MPRGIGLVLLDYDQAPTTRRCLRSVAAGSRRPDEIVLIENGELSVDLEYEKAIAELGVHVLSPEGNLGVAGGRNLGINYLVDNSKAERYVLLDNDTTVPSDFFELVESSSIERFEIAAPLILDMGSGEVIYAGGRFDRYRYPSVIPEWRDGDPAHRDVDWAPGAGLVFDRDTWLRVGGFDSWYRLMWEDVEWCDRAVRLGATIRVQPRLCVMHEAHQSSGGAFSPERVRQWGRNGTVFMFETVGWHSRLKWFAKEFRLVWGEVRAGWRSTATARLQGLAQGLREVWRRRLGRARTGV